MEKTDAELVALTLKDKDKFSLLIKRYESKLSRYIRRLTRLSNECIEDILQETFISTYKNLNNFNLKLKFSSWIYRIAHNQALNYLRKNKSKETIPLETEDDKTLNLIEILESNTDIKSETQQKENTEKVRQALNKLSRKYRDVLILYYLEEKEYAEISDILKKPMGTIATLLNRAKKRFKTLAQKYNLAPNQ